MDSKARTFTPWSHVVCLLYAQLAHALSLSDVCDALRLWATPYQDKAQRMEAAVRSMVPAIDRPTNVVPVAEERRELSLRELLGKRESGSVTVPDARPEIFFKLGHMPEALSLPREEFEEAYAKLGAQLKKDRALVVYFASETCEDAGLVRTALVKLGHAHVMVFSGGWAEWQAAGLGEEKTP